MRRVVTTVHRRGVLVTLLLAATLVPSASGASTATSPLACAQHVVSTWTPSQLAHETVAVSSAAQSLTIDTAAAAQGFGGLLLFGSTAPTTLPAVLHSLSARSPHHLTMAVMGDEEGGGIIRLSNLVGSWPWPQIMNETMSSSQIRDVAVKLGRDMMTAGLTMDLAPVADVDGRYEYPSATNPDGLRSFSGSPARDAIDVVAFAGGLAASGVVATVKHFPGLGGSSGNTDSGPATTKPWSVLQTTALVPFRAAIAAGVGAIMVSNAVVPGLTSLPAGLSSAVMHELRVVLGFQGLIVTDSLGAGALSAIGIGQVAGAARAVEAGADEVLAANPTTPAEGLLVAQQMATAIVNAEQSGRLPLARLQLAAAHVVAALNPTLCVRG